MSARELYSTARSAWPLLWRAVVRGQLFRPHCQLTAPSKDILCQYEAPIPVDDGITLTANLFRSRQAEREGRRLPVVMCAHPYDNRLLPALGKTPLGGPPLQYRIIPQSNRPRFSTLTSWESPDPDFWVRAGYAVVNLNLPGYGGSGGPATVFSEHQAKCFYEAIEWVARQPWCTGKVGLCGVSYLAISQYHVAACQHYGGPPPALKCICPWEGLTDMYRDVACPGGVDEIGFGPFWWATEVRPALSGSPAEFVRDNGALPADFLRRHPFYDDFWRQMAPKLEQITLPMLVCASFSDHGLHTVGSFRAFLKASSPRKWLYTHRGGKWDVFYSPEALDVMKQFMDCFLKDDGQSPILARPPVRLEVRASRDVIHQVREEQEWPLARTEYVRLHLASTPPRLDWTQPEAPSRVQHSARGGRSTFAIRFDRDLELTGYMKVRLWVQAIETSDDRPPPDDMVIFVAVLKRDRRGRIVPFLGSAGARKDAVSRGFCRVSRRELEPSESTKFQPTAKGTTHQPLEPGQIVPVDFALYPSSTYFAAGESLELVVSSAEIIPSPPFRKDVRANRGIHVLHCGGDFDSHLLAPVIPST